MKFKSLIAASAIALSSFGAYASTNLLTNGSFEQSGSSASFDTILAGGSLPGWSVLFGSVDLINSYWTASNGTKSLDLSGSGMGSIMQTFATIAGQKYHVSFDLAGNPDGDALKTLLVGLSPTQIYQFDATGKTKADMGWVTKGFDFIGTGASTSMTFTSFNNSAYGPALDNVSVTAVTAVTAVPEPESFAMMLAGLGLMGSIAQRRKQKSA